MKYIDHRKVEYTEKNIGVLDKLCPDVNGRYAIEVDFVPDGKVHTISCKIKEFISSKEDGIESGERLELKSSYGENAKLSIGMEGDTGYYFDGIRASDRYDYDNDYMEDGVSYLILEETKTTRYVFRVVWIEEQKILEEELEVNEITNEYCWFKAKHMKYHIIPD